MSLFTPAELRLLKIGDRAADVTYRPRGPSYRLGGLTDDEALLMHAEGKTTTEIAEAAGVTPDRVSHWKSARGLARKWTKRSAP